MLPKFRAWDKELKRWCPYNIGSYELVGDAVVEFLCVPQQTWYTNDDFNNFVLMQFTGMKDINDVDIYEGDVVEYFLEPGIIKRVKGGFAVVNTRDYEYTTGLLGQMKVLGNVYENPELLEVVE